MQRRRFARHHVLIERWRPPDGLARVVDDEIEPVASGEDFPAEGFDTRRVTQIEPIDLESIAPFREILFAGITRSRIARESRGDNERRARTQQLDSRLISDLDASAGKQCDASPQIGQLTSFKPIELRACRAQLIIEMVDR